MRLIHVNSLSAPGLAVYSSLTEAALRSPQQKEAGVFIAESPKVIRVALRAGYQPISILTEEKHITGDAADIMDMLPPDTPVYTGSRELLSSLTGYTLTRGVLCAMKRPLLPTVEQVCEGKRRVVVIDGVVDSTNVGAIFRSAAALGIEAVLLTRNSCDPLLRRSARVSMGSVFLVPWAWLDGTVQSLNSLGFKTVAMALTDKSISLDDARLASEPRLAIVMGTEGDGLPHDTISQSDYVVRIPMAHGVDSLNVAAASAVAFWVLGNRGN